MNTQELKNKILEAQNYMAKVQSTGNRTYEQIADKLFAEIIGEPKPNTLGAIIWAEFQGKKMYSQMSEKQAYCIARDWNN